SSVPCLVPVPCRHRTRQIRRKGTSWRWSRAGRSVSLAGGFAGLPRGAACSSGGPLMSHRFSRRTQLAMMLAVAATPFVPGSALAKTKKKSYVVVDLGLLPSGTYSIGNAISNNGIVAGMSINKSGSHAVRLKDLELSQLDGDSDASAANGV